METKLCPECGRELTVDNFAKSKANKDGLFYICKDCKKERNKQYYEKNKDKIKKQTKQYAETHKEKAREYRKKWQKNNPEKRKEWRENNKEYCKEYQKQYYNDNKERFKEYEKKYREKNAEFYKEYGKKYRQENPEKIKNAKKKYYGSHKEKVNKETRQWYENNKERAKEIRRKYFKKKFETDEVFKFRCLISNNISTAIRSHGYNKKTRTFEILGLSYEEIWEYLKETWYNNYGTKYNGENYHIDHIVPLATAKTEEDVIRLCHYTNLQLLKPTDNLKKQARLDWKLEN